MAWLAAQAGHPPFSLRLPSVLLGAASVPVVYALGALTVGRRAGLVAAVVMAVAPFSLFYGTEARAYSALMFFTAASTLAFVAALDSRRRWPAAYKGRVRTRRPPQPGLMWMQRASGLRGGRRREGPRGPVATGGSASAWVHRPVWTPVRAPCLTGTDFGSIVDLRQGRTTRCRLGITINREDQRCTP